MKLFEDMEDQSSSLKEMVVDIVKKYFGLDLDEEKAQEMVQKFALGDILALDKAYTMNDKFKISGILDKYIQLEYYSPGRGNLASAASQRPVDRTTSFTTMGKGNKKLDTPVFSQPHMTGQQQNIPNTQPQSNVNVNNPTNIDNTDQEEPVFNINIDKDDLTDLSPSLDLEQKKDAPTSYLDKLKYNAGIKR